MVIDVALSELWVFIQFNVFIGLPPNAGIYRTFGALTGVSNRYIGCTN